jgi:shikimate dehydrogenase
MKISAKTRMCIIIGDPVEHSLSPAMHNAAYKALNIDDQFVFTASHVLPENLEQAVQGVRALGVRGLTCTIPHKVEVMKYLDVVDPIAQNIGAINTVVNEDGVLTGYNTDWLGTVTALEEKTTLKGKKIALLGAGGAARAIAFGVVKKNAKLTIYNRTLQTAKDLANDLDSERVTAQDMSDLSSLGEADIIINSTSVGMGDSVGISLVPADLLHPGQIVFDAIYRPHKTRLIQDAEKAGCEVIYGYQMLLHQGTAQFKLYTGHDAPVDVMEHIITSNL